MRCENCGAEMAPGDHYCKNCGKSIVNNMREEDKLSRISKKMLKRTVIGVIIFGVVMFGMVAILIFMGTTYNVLERF